MPGICRTYCCLIKICPFASNSFHSWPLFTDSSGLIQILAQIMLSQWFFFFCTRFSNCFERDSSCPSESVGLFVLFCFVLLTVTDGSFEQSCSQQTFQVFLCLLLLLNVQPGDIAGKVSLPRCTCTCKQYPTKGVTPNRAFQCSFQETFLNACELGYYLDLTCHNFPLFLFIPQAVSHKPNLSLRIVLLKIFP